MSATDGARSGGDPVLEGALAEMSSAGEFDATATFADPAPTDASQTSDASATSVAAPPPTGDDGSSKAVSTTEPVSAAPVSAGTPAATPDPTAGSQPFTYSVNGVEKPLAGVYRFPGEGLLVKEADVPALQSRFERADLLESATRDMTSQLSTFERLSTWTRPGPDGKDETLTGQQGLEAIHTDFAQLSAEAAVYRSLLNNPEQLLGLMAKDESGKIVLNPEAVETWNTRIENAQIKAGQSIRSQIGTLLTPAQPTASSGAGPTSHASSAPSVIKQAAGGNFSALQPADHALLTKAIDRYIRPVTEADRAYNPLLKLGAPIVDAEYGVMVAHLAAQRASATQTAKAAETAGKHNAGMDKGRQPAKAAPKTPPASAGKQPEPARKKADWDSPFTEAMGELGIPVR